METIHLKTADPISQHLLRAAAQRGIDLPWERYEKAQPQDGFLRLGLSCPFECMHGPCRIDPFGRGASHTICGLDREQMVAATLLRLCRQAAMQALAAVPHCAEENRLTTSNVLGGLIDDALSAAHDTKLSCAEIVETAELLRRCACSHEELLTRALRLGLLTLALVEQAGTQAEADELDCRFGYGVIPEAPVRIAVSGRPSRALIQALEHEAQETSKPSAVLVSLGEWLQLDGRFMPIAVTSGEAELLLSSGAIHFLVAGPGTDPGILSVCEQLQIPVQMNGSKIDSEDVLKRARTRAGQAPSDALFADIPAGSLRRVIMSDAGFAQTLAAKSVDQLALIGGSDTPQLPHGSLPADLAMELSSRGIKIAGWGDPALWVAKQIQGEAPGQQPLILEKGQGPLLAVKGLAEKGRLDALKGICFTGMRDVTDVGMALGLAYLGCRVSMATPIPVHGSAVVGQALTQMVEENGGELLHFDHPAEAGRLVDWFTTA
ncbi:MAG: hypothetical protein P8X39_02480 [Desulfofustis sp.]